MFKSLHFLLRFYCYCPLVLGGLSITIALKCNINVVIMGEDIFADSGDEFEEDYKSKTQVKQEMLELVKLGEQVVELGASSLKKIPMDEELSESVDIARSMNRKKPSYKRQLQFIGKLLRSRETQPIRDALENLQGQQHKVKVHFHKLENLRDKLVDLGDDALQSLMQDYPHLDRQRLRQWIRQAGKEKQQNKPPKAYREIFQYLKQEIPETN